MHKRVGEPRKPIKTGMLSEFSSIVASRLVHFSAPPNTFHKPRSKFAIPPSIGFMPNVGGLPDTLQSYWVNDARRAGLQSRTMTTVVDTSTQPARTPEKELQRQFVNFMFFKVDRAFRRENADIKAQAKREFAEIVERFTGSMMILPYSNVGLKSTVDFMLWRISFEIEPLQQMAAAINKSVFGRYLDVPQSYLAMTKHSQYVQEHVHDGQEGRRTRIVPGKKPFLFVYPFVKTRDWYLLPQPERQRIMNEHIAVGHKYPRVKINTTYSFGLDDQDFVVAFEADAPAEFLDLVQELRETESSKYTLRDTPMYTCRRATIEEILDSLA